jgi:transposase
VARGDLTDERWAVLELLSPKGKKPGRPPIWTRRQLMNRSPKPERYGV